MSAPAGALNIYDCEACGALRPRQSLAHQRPGEA